jgi:hypothetical protein
LAFQLDEDSLRELAFNRQIGQLYDFGCNEIFWIEFLHRERPAVEIPPFKTNFKLLKKWMEKLIESFFDRIDIIDRGRFAPEKKRSRRVLNISRSRGNGKK